MQIEPGMPHLITRSLSPENQETPIYFTGNPETPESLYYRRNHFPYPPLSEKNFALTVKGRVNRPTVFSISDLVRLPGRTVEMAMECAGNKRARFEPKVYGEQWRDGAISQGKWRGVPLRNLLNMTGIRGDAAEVVFEGHDKGDLPGYDRTVRYARSLPLEKALHPDTIVAYELNRKPIPGKHGYPLRLIVPDWYGMASVKWLKTVKVINSAFEGPFQADDYVYYQKNGEPYPVTTMNVNSIIQKPLAFEILNKGMQVIKGLAWSGEGEISTVEVSTDSGITWKEAILARGSRYSWSYWQLEWKALPGEYEILARARDSAGRIQPMEAMWNKKGYGYNAVSKRQVKVK